MQIFAVMVVWFREVFLVHAPAAGDQQRILLLDGWKGHLTPELIRLAIENKVAILKLPPNTTHESQPMDKTVIYAVKQALSEILNERQQQGHRHPGKLLFPTLLGQAWRKAFTPANAMAGFRACGIAPFNSHVFDERLAAMGHTEMSSDESSTTDDQIGSVFAGSSNRSATASLRPVRNASRSSSNLSQPHRPLLVADLRSPQSERDRSSRKRPRVAQGPPLSPTAGGFLRDPLNVPAIRKSPRFASSVPIRSAANTPVDDAVLLDDSATTTSASSADFVKSRVADAKRSLKDLDGKQRRRKPTKAADITSSPVRQKIFAAEAKKVARLAANSNKVADRGGASKIVVKLPVSKCCPATKVLKNLPKRAALSSKGNPPSGDSQPKYDQSKCWKCMRKFSDKDAVGNDPVGCQTCDRWYHMKCVRMRSEEIDDFYSCYRCQSEQAVRNYLD